MSHRNGLDPNTGPARTVSKHPLLGAPYGTKSPRYPTAGEQRKRLRNARSKWTARSFLVSTVIAVGHLLATAAADLNMLLFLAAGLAGFGAVCLHNYGHNEPHAVDHIDDPQCAKFFRWEHRFLALAALSFLLLTGVLGYMAMVRV